jgi:hypothetical protein
MNKNFKIPPKTPSHLTSVEVLKEIFKPLIGQEFLITGKSRTDGSNVRKLIASALEKHDLPEPAQVGDFEIVTLKGKGIPKITRDFIDTYIVTSGKSYNLQVWNRIPSSETLLVSYDSGRNLKSSDVRYVFVKINTDKHTVDSITIMSTDYIVSNFGKFGIPTIKHQLLISSKVRKQIYNEQNKILFFSDTELLKKHTLVKYEDPLEKFNSDPKSGKLYSLELIRELILDELIGYKIPAGATKNRGQELERKVAELLGYTIENDELLAGGFPDIPNQLLEIKIQDSPTVDLGKFSPDKEEQIDSNLKASTFDMRYLIALTDSETETIKGIILSPGEKLGEVFSYVSDQSYKCQRSIPMSVFTDNLGFVAYNPPL